MAHAAHVRVVTAHRAPDREPLALQPGDAVQIEERTDPEARLAAELWPAFVWIRAGDRHGWVPRRHLDIDDWGRGTALRAYDTIELSANEGEVVEVVEDDAESGWFWARNGAGREGWMPWNAVER